MHSVPLSLFISFFSFLLLLFLTMNPHYMTSYNLVFYCSIKKRNLFFATLCVCVHRVCHGYQLCVCCAVPNEHIRPWVCQRLSGRSCRLVYNEWQQRGRVADKHTHVRTHFQTYKQTDTLNVGLSSLSSFFSDLDCVEYFSLQNKA